MRCKVRAVSLYTRVPYIHLTQGHPENHMDTAGSTRQGHWPAYLKGLGLEATGLPEDTNHLSTMLVIEEESQTVKGFLERTERKQDYNRYPRTSSMAAAPPNTPQDSQSCKNLP